MLHNDWRKQNAPMITFYSDRIEILSFGPLSPKLSIKNFYKGTSEPINKKLSDIFLQLHISEKTGRGIPVIVSKYGKKAFDLGLNSIEVTIPYNYEKNVGDKLGDKVGDKVGDKILNNSQNLVLFEIRKNPNITKPELCNSCNLKKTSIDNIIKFLKDENYIKRIGSNKTGHWKIIKK